MKLYLASPKLWTLTHLGTSSRLSTSNVDSISRLLRYTRVTQSTILRYVSVSLPSPGHHYLPTPLLLMLPECRCLPWDLIFDVNAILTGSWKRVLYRSREILSRSARQARRRWSARGELRSTWNWPDGHSLAENQPIPRPPSMSLPTPRSPHHDGQSCRSSPFFLPSTLVPFCGSRAFEFTLVLVLVLVLVLAHARARARADPLAIRSSSHAYPRSQNDRPHLRIR